MYKSTTFALASLLIFIDGCAESGKTKAIIPGVVSGNDLPYICESDPCDRADIQRSLAQNLMTCIHMQNHYEINDNRKRWTNLTIGGLGALAGAVFAPLAKGSSTKAWSGFAGSASAFQTQLQEQYSSLAFVEIRSAIVDEMIADQAEFDAADGPDKVIKANKMGAMCRTIASKAERAIQNAISSASEEVKESVKEQKASAKKAATASTPAAASSSRGNNR